MIITLENPFVSCPCTYWMAPDLRFANTHIATSMKVLYMLLLVSSGKFNTSKQKASPSMMCKSMCKETRGWKRDDKNLVYSSCFLLISAHPVSEWVCVIIINHKGCENMFKHSENFTVLPIGSTLRCVGTQYAYASVCKWVIRESRASWMFRPSLLSLALKLHSCIQL